jgi:hypothetical protein
VDDRRLVRFEGRTASPLPVQVQRLLNNRFNPFAVVLRGWTSDTCSEVVDEGDGPPVAVDLLLYEVRGAEQKENG